ncbi:hypothetical protein BJ973_003222 [Actinoplanes tereljensis]
MPPPESAVERLPPEPLPAPPGAPAPRRPTAPSPNGTRSSRSDQLTFGPRSSAPDPVAVPGPPSPRRPKPLDPGPVSPRPPGPCSPGPPDPSPPDPFAPSLPGPCPARPAGPLDRRSAAARSPCGKPAGSCAEWSPCPRPRSCPVAPARPPPPADPAGAVWPPSDIPALIPPANQVRTRIRSASPAATEMSVGSPPADPGRPGPAPDSPAESPPGPMASSCPGRTSGPADGAPISGPRPRVSRGVRASIRSRAPAPTAPGPGSLVMCGPEPARRVPESGFPWTVKSAVILALAVRRDRYHLSTDHEVRTRRPPDRPEPTDGPAGRCAKPAACPAARPTEPTDGPATRPVSAARVVEPVSPGRRDRGSRRARKRAARRRGRGPSLR